MYTVYTYILYARECVRIYSGFSKRIPSLGSPEGGICALLTLTSEPYRVRAHITLFKVQRETVALDQGHI